MPYVDETFVSRCLVDGVLNSQDYVDGPVFNRRGGIIDIDEITLPILKNILDKTGAVIVVSSSWREDEQDLKLLWDTLIEYGIPKTDYVTPSLYNVNRGEEILLWLKENKHLNIKNYAILDDDAWDRQTPEIKSHFFKTTYRHGLTQEIAEKVIDFLNKE